MCVLFVQTAKCHRTLRNREIRPEQRKKKTMLKQWQYMNYLTKN